MSLRIAVVTAGLAKPSSTRLLADRLAAATAEALEDEAEIEVVELGDIARDPYAASEDFASGELTGRIKRAAGELAALAAARPPAARKDPYTDPTPFEELLRS